MPQRLRVLAPTRYQWRFHGPCASRHRIENRDYLPLNYISSKIEGITAFNPFPMRRFDLIHAHNRIPVSNLPFVIGFESHMPRGFWLERTRYIRMLTEHLAGPQCRAIVAMSDCARRIFHAVHQDGRWYAALTAKLQVRLPSIELPAEADALAEPPPGRFDAPIRICFVGNHFARKGGCVAVVLARLARQAGFPLQVDIVSNLEVGDRVWSDPTDPGFFAPYFALLREPNVTLHRNLPNAAVVALLRQSHFSMLTTFADTFGFSAIESMANHTPVIATRQGALPEFITDGVDGILLDLPTKPNGEWLHIDYNQRGTAAYAARMHAEIERLAADAFAAIVALHARPGALTAMRARSRQTAEEKFAAPAANAFWDDLYERAVENCVTAVPSHASRQRENVAPATRG
jgi:glycosyltransferase involved in cell wall biosynthesis